MAPEFLGLHPPKRTRAPGGVKAEDGEDGEDGEVTERYLSVLTVSVVSVLSVLSKRLIFYPWA
jgi:hypothetical protein